MIPATMPSTVIRSAVHILQMQILPMELVLAQMPDLTADQMTCMEFDNIAVLGRAKNNHL